MRTRTLIAGALAPLLLAGCGSAANSARIPPPASAGTRPAPPPIFRAPPAGDPVLGQTVAAVSNLLGQPRLDLREGAGRKLQYRSAGCVVDIYFYAPRPQSEPVATHIDARGQDGRDADRAYCIGAMAKR